MSAPKTAVQRTQAARAAAANVLAFPVVYEDASAPSSAPPPFDGEWQHSTAVGPAILASGWKPDLVKNTIYGAAVYLSRAKWEPSHPHVIRCRLSLQRTECLATFKSQAGTGNDQNHVLRHIGEAGETATR